MNTYKSKALKLVKKISTPNNLTASSISKISLVKNNSFSMLAGVEFSCIGETEACKDCYAMKKRHLFDNVQMALARNWMLIKKLSDKKDTKTAVNKLLEIIPENSNLFRIHESGDFFNNWYVDVWNDVVINRRQTYFWCYVRSFELNFSKIVRQPNFALWASIDDYNKDQALDFIKRYKNSSVKLAYGPYKHNAETPESSIICPATNHKIEINGACNKCKLCVIKDRIAKNIVFLQH